MLILLPQTQLRQRVQTEQTQYITSSRHRSRRRRSTARETEWWIWRRRLSHQRARALAGRGRWARTRRCVAPAKGLGLVRPWLCSHATALHFLTPRPLVCFAQMCWSWRYKHERFSDISSLPALLDSIPHTFALLTDSPGSRTWSIAREPFFFFEFSGASA